MQDATAIEQIALRFRDLAPLMDERMRRQWAASEATSYGWGGIEAVSRATGMSPTTIRRGSAELWRGGFRRELQFLVVFVWSAAVTSNGRMPIQV